MTIDTPVELIRAFAEYRAEDVLGTPEGARLDFKSTAPSPRTERQKWEFAKDVAALSNHDGGLLAYGIRTRRDANQALDVADSLTPFATSDFNAESLKALVIQRCRPPVDIAVHWFPVSAEDSAIGYVIVEVTAVPSDERYCVVSGVADDAGGLLHGVSVPVRHGDRTRHLTVDELHRLIRDGLRHRNRSEQAASDATTTSSVAEADQAIEWLERRQEWSDEPTVYWQSWPASLTPIRLDLYGEDGVERRLRDRPVRYAGFNLANPYVPFEVIDGTLTLSDERMALAVTPSGLITAGASASNDFLGWAMRERGRPGQLNVVALTECTVDYFKVVDDIVRLSDAGAVRHRVVARNLQSSVPPVSLVEGRNPDFPFSRNSRVASSDAWTREFDGVGLTERDAFEWLQEFYTLFGLDVTTNPYVAGNRLDTRNLGET